MDILIHSNILRRIATEVDQSELIMKLIQMLYNSPNVNLWLCSHALLDMYRDVEENQKNENDLELMGVISNKFSTIPFMGSVFQKVIAENNCGIESQLQIKSAELFKIDCIIAYNVDQTCVSNIPIYSPKAFNEKWRQGEFETPVRVPFMDLKIQRHQIYNEINDRIADIVSNTAYILGEHVEEFETNFAKLQGAAFCIGVSSGTDALHISLLAHDIGPGDTIVVPTNTFIATAEAVSMTGARPVFIDCDKYFNIDIENLREYLNTAKNNNNKLPKAVIPVHLYGQPANMKDVISISEEYNLAVIEDCCQAHLAAYEGKKVGNWGSFGAFSFYPGKNLGAYGEAGALITNDGILFSKARMLRQHGEIKRYYHEIVGHNYRMSAIQGAVLSTKLKYLEEWTQKRHENAKHYNRLLKDVEGIDISLELPKTCSVYHLYVIKAEKRDELKEYLEKHNISTGLHYPIPLHLQKAYAGLGYQKGDFPRAESDAKRIISLPMYPELRKKQIEYVCQKIKAFYK